MHEGPEWVRSRSRDVLAILKHRGHLLLRALELTHGHDLRGVTTRSRSFGAARRPVVQARRAVTLQRAPLPHLRSVRLADLVWLTVGNGALILLMWVRHGGLDQLRDVSGTLTAGGQLAALFGTYLALVELVLMSRSPWLDQQAGMHRLVVWHRWVGFACIWLLVAHTALTTVGYALGDRIGVLGEAWTLLTTYPYVLMGTVALLLLIGVGVASVRTAQRRVSYETWYGIHLYTYLAFVLGFGHQLAVGTDFQTDPIARLYWVLLYVIAAALVLVFRFGQPLRNWMRHRLHVADVVAESPGVVSVYVRGRHLDQLAVRAGQYFVWRFLTRDGWWRAHPFSLSAAPNGRLLRLTIRADGDYTAQLLRLRPGTRVAAEGPYGILTGARRTREKVLLIAGGIGITPLRALLEELPAEPGGLTLLYRARHWNDVVFAPELDHLARRRGAQLHYLVGRRGTPELPDDPLTPAGLRALVPDIADRDVFVCGPIPMLDAVRRSLDRLHVPRSQVHIERFEY
jgi:predicted ferric reductase